MDGYCDHCKTVFEAMGCYYHFCSCQEARPSLTDQDIEAGKPLSTDSLLAKLKVGPFFGYVQCNLVVSDELKSKFANFPPNFNNTEVGRKHIGDYIKNYAIENEMFKHPQRMLISSLKLENGTVITPLFNFYLELGLQCTKNQKPFQ